MVKTYIHTACLETKIAFPPTDKVTSWTVWECTYYLTPANKSAAFGGQGICVEGMQWAQKILVSTI